MSISPGGHASLALMCLQDDDDFAIAVFHFCNLHPWRMHELVLYNSGHVELISPFSDVVTSGRHGEHTYSRFGGQSDHFEVRLHFAGDERMVPLRVVVFVLQPVLSVICHKVRRVLPELTIPQGWET